MFTFYLTISCFSYLSGNQILDTRACTPSCKTPNAICQQSSLCNPNPLSTEARASQLKAIPSVLPRKGPCVAFPCVWGVFPSLKHSSKECKLQKRNSCSVLFRNMLRRQYSVLGFGLNRENQHHSIPKSRIFFKMCSVIDHARESTFATDVLL